MFLRGLGEYAGRDGDGLLGAAGLGVLWRGEDLRAVPVQGHRRRAQRTADLSRGGGALHPVVAVFVVAGETAELAVRQGAASAVFASCAAACSGVVLRASGPSSSRVRGVAGPERGPLAGMGRWPGGAGTPSAPGGGGSGRSRPGCRRGGCRLLPSRSARG